MGDGGAAAAAASGAAGEGDGEGGEDEEEEEEEDDGELPTGCSSSSSSSDDEGSDPEVVAALPLARRNSLTAPIPASFAAYCQQLGCSLPPTPRAAVLDWLLCWAVGLEDRDGAERFTPSQTTLDSDQAKLEQLSLDEQTLTGGACSRRARVRSAAA